MQEGQELQLVPMPYGPFSQLGDQRQQLQTVHSVLPPLSGHCDYHGSGMSRTRYGKMAVTSTAFATTPVSDTTSAQKSQYTLQ